MSPSSSGLGHRPFTAVTGVRTPVGTPITMFNLKPHANYQNPSIQSLQASITRTNYQQLHLQYILSANLEQLVIAAPSNPSFQDRLWEHTCFELFIQQQGETAYYEYNFSPSSQWAAYGFNDYRQINNWQAKTTPIITSNQSATLLQLDVQLDLPESLYHQALSVGLTAVLETRNNELSYWALKHPQKQPDFHDKNGFILTL